MTKVFRAPILLDEVSAAVARSTLPADEARLRRVAVVQPYGVESSLEVSELLPPESQNPQITDEDIKAYEAALEALLDRQWQRAFELLHQVTAEDRVKDFLTVFIAQHNRTPPKDWGGVISLQSK
jgi:adenylate cyclase